MSEDNRKSGFMVGTALALSLSLAACATHTPVKTEPTDPGVEQSEPERLPGLKPPVFQPIESGKKKDHKVKGQTGETETPPVLSDSTGSEDAYPGRLPGLKPPFLRPIKTNYNNENNEGGAEIDFDLSGP